jgi:ABC-type transport system involved in cytochrome bd biosynthesis fused ATPase/permease subunit
MSLFQRGQSCEERSLSGGEYDRLALAVSLTLYRLFASKVGILCLDESLSSLDAEVSNGILMRLHDNRTLVPGLVVMVDHHNGTGMFDYTLRV